MVFSLILSVFKVVLHLDFFILAKNLIEPVLQDKTRNPASSG